MWEFIDRLSDAIVIVVFFLGLIWYVTGWKP